MYVFQLFNSYFHFFDVFLTSSIFNSILPKKKFSAKCQADKTALKKQLRWPTCIKHEDINTWSPSPPWSYHTGSFPTTFIISVCLPLHTLKMSLNKVSSLITKHLRLSQNFSSIKAATRDNYTVSVLICQVNVITQRFWLFFQNILLLSFFFIW